jgi:four helix bundle protein
VQLAVECYELTRAFPASEIYGLTSQIRRSSASVAANIAEGYGRESTATFIHFLRVAQGSLKELETHGIIAGRVGLVSGPELDSLLEHGEEVGKMLRSMIRKLQQKP